LFSLNTAITHHSACVTEVRMGFIEKLLPDTIPLTEEQFKTFVEQTIATDHSRRVLDGLTAQNAATVPAQGAGTVGRGKHPARRQDRPDSAGGRHRRECGARVTGLRSEAGRGTTLPPALLGVTASLFCRRTGPFRFSMGDKLQKMCNKFLLNIFLHRFYVMKLFVFWKINCIVFGIS